MGLKIPKGKSDHSKSIGFGKITLKKFPELTPLVTFVCTGALLCAVYSFFALYQKSDVRFNKLHEIAPWERIDPSKSQKIVDVEQKYEPIPEIEQLRKEIGAQKN